MMVVVSVTELLVLLLSVPEADSRLVVVPIVPLSGALASTSRVMVRVSVSPTGRFRVQSPLGSFSGVNVPLPGTIDCTVTPAGRLSTSRMLTLEALEGPLLEAVTV